MKTECQVAVAVATRVKIHVSTVDPYDVRKLCSTQIVKRAMMACADCLRPPRDDSSPAGQRNCLGFTSFSIRDLLRSKEPRCSLKLRTMDGVNEVGDVTVSRLQLEEETEDKCPENKSAVLCDALHGSVQDKENSPMMRAGETPAGGHVSARSSVLQQVCVCAALCSQVCKLYRFQTEDHRWLLVREQMSETPLSFSLPKQLLSALIREHTDRVVEVKALGDLSPHWDGLRHDAVAHSLQLIGCYQQTQAELHCLSSEIRVTSSSMTQSSLPHLTLPPLPLPAASCFKASSSKSDRHLQFIPTNLHSQRMEVTGPDSSGVWYEVVTFGAPADHHQAFKHGGLKRLLIKHTDHTHSSPPFSRDESCRAKRLLAAAAQLQPLIFGLAEQLLCVSMEVDPNRLQDVLDDLMEQTSLFIQALNDDLVKVALQDMNNQACSSSHLHSNGLLCEVSPGDQEGAPRPQDDAQNRVEEWAIQKQRKLSQPGNPVCGPFCGHRLCKRDRTWANVGKSLDCITAMVERLQEQQRHLQEQPSPEQQESTGETKSQHTEGGGCDCRSGSNADRPAAPRCLQPGAIVCGFMLKLFGGLEDPEFLQQLLSVGILAQGRFVVQVPLPSESFRLLPEELKAGRLIRVEPVLFNIGINQHQSLAERFGDSSLQERVNQQSCERLRVYCNKLREKLPNMAGIQSLLDLLSSLDRNIESKKRKNVEVLWLAASVCRKVNGVRLTSCKSAKDRTAMSVTLEQCTILREQHALSQQHFRSALDNMRRCCPFLFLFSHDHQAEYEPENQEVRGHQQEGHWVKVSSGVKTHLNPGALEAGGTICRVEPRDREPRVGIAAQHLPPGQTRPAGGS
ncbi:hypothetical protein CCH79_00018613, partial [Gambusia affinis]